MRTPQWVKKLGSHAGEHYVCAELSKRGIPNALLPENFPHDDIMVSDKDGMHTAYIQVKACHPERSKSFILRYTHEEWCSESSNKYCIFVWLGSPATNESPRYWIALKSEVGQQCVQHAAHGTGNWERRFFPDDFPEPRLVDRLPRLPQQWRDRWFLFDKYRPTKAEQHEIAEKKKAEASLLVEPEGFLRSRGPGMRNVGRGRETAGHGRRPAGTASRR